ncbi:MAG: hypothetical protein FWC43_06640 [Planctomycetaceae bacterium]|nr:hypothetical protein [Planctomycetaceae bacterium]
METTPLLGFLTVINHPSAGFVGGFLVLNPVGRPVEFHCTTSLKPNRAQEILFGNALEPYLFGEQIAQTLVRKSQANIDFLFTDLPGVLALQDFVEQPIIYVPHLDSASGRMGSGEHQHLFSRAEAPPKQYQPLRSVPGLSMTRWKETQIADFPLWIPNDRNMEVSAISARLTDCISFINFSEPFDRVRLALEEAQKN